MAEESLAWWVEHLPFYDVQIMCVQAAKEHPHGFLFPEQVGMLWASQINSKGYNGLGSKWCRNFLAHKYLRYQEADFVKGKAIP